jgi:spore coat protein U-like protein
MFFSTHLFYLLPTLSQCAINVSGVSFNSYDVFATFDPTSTGSITYNCSSAVPVPTSITIDLTQGNASTYNPRQLTNGQDALSYNLYLDASGQSIWGNGTAGNQHYISSALSSTVYIYGIIPARQNAKVGTYTDAITATINF